MTSKGITALAMMTALTSGMNLRGSDYHNDSSGPSDNSRPSTLNGKQKKDRKKKNRQRKKANRKNRK